MSYSEKISLVLKMVEMIDGCVGRWANEAKDIIGKAKTAIEVSNKDEFDSALKNWDRHLLQAPPHVYSQYVMGQ